MLGICLSLCANIAAAPKLSVFAVAVAAEPTAEQRMWAYCVTERSKGHTPTGAELDRISGTSNYGRKVLRRWRQAGCLPAAASSPPDRQVDTLECAVPTRWLGMEESVVR